MDYGTGRTGAAHAAARLVNAAGAGGPSPDWVDRTEAAGGFPVMHRLLPPVGAPQRAAELAALTAGLAELARDLRPVFGDDPGAAAARVTTLLAPLRVQVAVSRHDAQRPHLHYDAADSAPAVRVRVSCLAGLAGALCDPSGLHRLGTCAAADCAAVFVDTSRSARQRYCSRRCATRSHVRAHRATGRAGTS